MAEDWLRALRGMSQQAVERACDEYLRTSVYPPTIADIYQLARKHMPALTPVEADPVPFHPISAERRWEIQREAGLEVEK